MLRSLLTDVDIFQEKKSFPQRPKGVVVHFTPEKEAGIRYFRLFTMPILVSCAGYLLAFLP
jgi:hypothetical protein